MTQKCQTRPVQGRVRCDLLGRPSHLHPIAKTTLRHPRVRLLVAHSRLQARGEACARSTTWILPARAAWGKKAGEAMSSPTPVAAMRHPTRMGRTS